MQQSQVSCGSLRLLTALFVVEWTRGKVENIQQTPHRTPSHQTSPRLSLSCFAICCKAEHGNVWACMSTLSDRADRARKPQPDSRMNCRETDHFAVLFFLFALSSCPSSRPQGLHRFFFLIFLSMCLAPPHAVRLALEADIEPTTLCTYFPRKRELYTFMPMTPNAQGISPQTPR